MKQFVRDSTVRFNIYFYDLQGNILTPPAAQVTLSYLPKISNSISQRTFTTYALTQITDVSSDVYLSWQYDWDSSVAEPCIVHGHASTVNNPQVATDDFNFRLTGNHANRELAGDDVIDPAYR
jgi:hypothetical protein